MEDQLQNLLPLLQPKEKKLPRSNVFGPNFSKKLLSLDVDDYLSASVQFLTLGCKDDLTDGPFTLEVGSNIILNCKFFSSENTLIFNSIEVSVTALFFGLILLDQGNREREQ